MKKYDYEKAKKIITSRKVDIIKASLGMYEDWFWTAVTVFEDGEFSMDLSTDGKIAGIDGSYWATPTLRLDLKDGSDECIPCYTGESTQHQPSSMFMLSVLSGPVQDSMPPLTFSDPIVDKK